MLYIGLWLFLLSGALYFVAGTVGQLIAVSALLGVGAGIIIPLSTSLVSRFFAGEERTRQYGYISAITNIALVVATAVTGWLADIEWRLPFLVYLLPIVSLVLVPAIGRCDNVATQGNNAALSATDDFLDYTRLSRYMFYYLLITYLVMAVTINLPFLSLQRGTAGQIESSISRYMQFILLAAKKKKKSLTNKQNPTSYHMVSTYSLFPQIFSPA